MRRSSPAQRPKKRVPVMQIFLGVAAIGTLYSVGFAVGRQRGPPTSVDDDGVKEPAPSSSRLRQRQRHASQVRKKKKGSREVAFYLGANKTASVPSFWAPTELAHAGRGDPRVTLCELDFDGYWRNPTKTPMFRDLVSASRCGRGKSGSLDDLFGDLVRRKGSGKNNKPPLEPSGFVFHESRVGSTLVANMLASIPTNLVYSESAPPPTILNHCTSCSMDRKVDLLRKLFALMGNSPFHTRLYYKFQSITVPSMAPLLLAFPKTPWIFVYREPVQVMMSHFKHGGRTAPCLREHKRPRRETADILETDVAAASRVRPEAYCAAHLAMLCEAALDAADREARRGNAENALLLNYESLPGALVHYVVPDHFNVDDYDADDKLRMLDVANVYSKRRKALPAAVEGATPQQDAPSAVAPDVTWGGDSQAKMDAASTEIKAAANDIMRPRYDRLLDATKLRTGGDDLRRYQHMPLPGTEDLPSSSS